MGARNRAATPTVKNATIVFRPCSRLLEPDKIIEAQSVESFLEERYPGWKQDFLTFYAKQIGVEQLMALKPMAIAALGIMYALMKERKI